MRFIEHIIEPDKLLLSWQAPTHRQRMFVAELIRDGDSADLVYLKDSNEFSEAENLGFKGYPGFVIDEMKHENVLPSFMRRLPPRSRGDFNRFLGALRIKPETDISDFTLLGYAGAKLPDDDFTVIHPFENANVPFELMVESQGYQHYSADFPKDQLTTEMQAYFEAEPDNQHDPDAIRITINNVKVGYVCRGLTASFHKWMQSGLAISAYVERINGTDQHPKIYLYVSVK